MANTKSISLNGSSQYLTNGNTLDNQANFTIEFWIKTTATTGKIITKITETGGGTGWAVYFAYGAGRTGVLIQSAAWYVWCPALTVVADGNWHHCAYVRSGSETIVIYTDTNVDTGTVSKGGTPASISNANNVIIGQDSNIESGQYLGGLIDEVRLWSTARSGAQIAANWKTSIDSATGLVASWHFNDALTDSAGSGNTLTGTGSPGYSADIPYTDAASSNSNFLMFM